MLAVLLALLGGCNPQPVSLQRLIDQLSTQTAQAQLSLPSEPTQPESGAQALAAWALLLAQEDQKRLAEQIAERAALLFEHVDPVWRGVLEQPAAQLQPVPDELGFATRIETQSAAMQVFAIAYWLTGEKRFRTAFAGVDGYLQDWLRGSGGAFAAGQALQPPSLRRPFTAADYWQLRREHDRRQLGLPAVQGSASAQALAALGLSYLVAADAFEDEIYLVEAERLAEASLAAVQSNARTRKNVQQSCRTAPQQLQLLISLYQRSAIEAWLQQAEDVTAALIEQWSQQDGCASLAKTTPETGLAYVELALALRSLALINRDIAFAPLLEPLLQAAYLQVENMTEHQALVLARHERALRGGFVAIQVSGQQSDPRTRALLSAAWHAWHPRKVVMPLSNAEAVTLSLPESPGAVVCNTRRCAPAMTSAPALSAAIAELRKPGATALAEQVSYFLGSSLTPREAVDE
ncbi:MAG: hypothetical protein ACR2PZ_12970 [Pseudomonadales bacterium]